MSEGERESSTTAYNVHTQTHKYMYTELQKKNQKVYLHNQCKKFICVDRLR